LDGGAGDARIESARPVILSLPSVGVQSAVGELETERRRLALDLHDTVAQALAVVRMALESAMCSGDSGAVERVAETLPIVDAAIAQVRELIFGLRPPALEELGLTAALKWSLEHLTRSTDLHTKLHADGGLERLPMDVQVACYRIAHEAIANAVRHAKAANLTVTLGVSADLLRLEVADDGQGLLGRGDTAIMPAGGLSGFGLRGMAERAAAIGGRVEITSGVTPGTKVVALLPIARNVHS
jgi:signal transduction histidine kinase